MLTIKKDDLPKIAQLAALAQVDTSNLPYNEAQLVLAFYGLLKWQEELFGVEPLFELDEVLTKPLMEKEDDTDE